MPQHNLNDAKTDTVIQTGHGTIRRYADDGKGIVININTGDVARDLTDELTDEYGDVHGDIEL
ncbi:hypothetical protein [Saccharopolyspora taberi]|uniref:Uncharacterized protein n=1 Tax=Saccharopolyspora taberi TaxID=60895 RepID=A0ABN3V8F7_9PSEU